MSIHAFIEIEKGSNIKYEWNKETESLEVDRVLTEPYVYPFAYGFIPGTYAEDGDELDILVLSDKPIPINTYVQVYIIGAMLMEDEKGNDEKILAVLPEDYLSGKIRDICDVPSQTTMEIQSFFANYKINEPGKWSRVDGFVNREYAFQIYKGAIYIPKSHEW
jgi:inorganic pyrophosphatase